MRPPARTHRGPARSRGSAGPFPGPNRIGLALATLIDQTGDETLRIEAAGLGDGCGSASMCQARQCACPIASNRVRRRE